MVPQKHGGAWGSGEPWLYRLTALPFLENNQAVAIVGYRTYPDGTMQDQVNDINLAIQTLSSKYPVLFHKPTLVEESDWHGISIIAHSRYELLLFTEGSRLLILTFIFSLQVEHI